MSELGVSLRRAWARSWRVVAQMAERCGWTSSLVRRANPVAVHNEALTMEVMILETVCRRLTCSDDGHAKLLVAPSWLCLLARPVIMDASRMEPRKMK